ncbi:protein PET100 homolog, mitochondrial isoform X4 [Pelodiscus sinensis]|uniref:protein PET100 homolog, mitochondrial isoform X4 n=1 Tax=Pelodiscus sinensis TaxID=13735 RepID=UPI003F6B5A81
MGVKLEVFRMVLYLSFPVAMFWISNQAEYFEEYVIKRKREIYPPEDERQDSAGIWRSSLLSAWRVWDQPEGSVCRAPPPPRDPH